MTRTIGETYSFCNQEFRLVEDHILPEDKKMPLLYRLNGLAILFIVVFSLVTVAFFWGNINVTFNFLGVTLYLLSFVVYVVVHELLHGIAFVLFSGQSWKTMKFGLILKNGLAYCISLVPVSISRARVSLMMPIYIVCLPLYVYAFATNSFALAILAVLFASGSVGDFYYLWQLRGTNRTLYMMEELPTAHGYEIGYRLYEKC